MIRFLDLIQSFAVEWLVVITILLGGAFLMQCLVRNHLLKQRIGELGIACVLLWSVLAFVPMPRWSSQLTSGPSSISADSPTEEPSGKFISNNRSIEREPSFQVGTNFQQREESQSTPPLNLKLPAKSGQFDWVPDSDNTLEKLSATSTDQSIQAWTRSEKTTVAVATYILGSLLFAIWIGIGYVVLAFVWIGGLPANPKVRAIFENLKPQNGPTPVLRIGKSDRTFIFGILRPKIVLSQNVQAGDSNQQITSLLLHELAHCQQRDVWGRALFNLAMPLLYLHPFYWACRRQSDLSAEVIADHLATQRVDLKTYVQALVDVCRQVANRKDWMASCSYRGMASFFTRRMKAILGTKTQMTSLSQRAQVACGLFAIAVALSTASVIGHSNNEPGERQDRLEDVRNSLAGQKSHLELAANRLPANTEVYVALDSSAIQRWSPEHLRLLKNIRRGEQVSGRMTGLHIAKREIASIMEAVAITENDLLELANGQVVFAVCPAKEDSFNENPSALIVETTGTKSAVDNLVNQIKESLPHSSMQLLTIENTRCFEISNRDQAVYVLPEGDQLMLTNNRELLKDLFSKQDRLTNDPLFLKARTKVMNQSADSSVDVFGFVRPVKFAARLNESEDGAVPGEQGTEFLLKTLLRGKSGQPTDSFAFVVQEEHDEIATTCWLGFENEGSGEIEVLNALQRVQWEANSPAGLQGRTVLNINGPELLDAIGPIVDQTSGTPGSFRRALLSLRDDPQGPQVDIAGLTDRLDSAVTFSWQFVGGSSPAEWMLEIPIARDVDICRDELARLLRGDYDLTVTPGRPELEFWVGRAEVPISVDVEPLASEFGDDQSEKEIKKEATYARRSVGIINDRLIIATSPEMILGMHDSIVAGRTLNSTSDYQRVVDRMNQPGATGRIAATNHGFWFERLPQGLLGTVLQKEESGWRIHSVLQSVGRR